MTQSDQSFQSALGEFYDKHWDSWKAYYIDIEDVITKWEDFRLTKSTNRIKMAEQAVDCCLGCFGKLRQSTRDGSLVCHQCSFAIWPEQRKTWLMLERLFWRPEQEVYHPNTTPRSYSNLVIESADLSLAGCGYAS